MERAWKNIRTRSMRRAELIRIAIERRLIPGWRFPNNQTGSSFSFNELFDLVEKAENGLVEQPTKSVRMQVIKFKKERKKEAKKVRGPTVREKIKIQVQKRKIIVEKIRKARIVELERMKIEKRIRRKVKKEIKEEQRRRRISKTEKSKSKT